MKTMEVSWDEFKSIVASKNIRSKMQWTKNGSCYDIFVFDGPTTVSTTVSITNPTNRCQHEFETQYKNNCNKILEPSDANNAILSRVKVTETGWSYQLHSFDFTTSKLNSTNSFNSQGEEISYSNIKLYKENGQEITDVSEENLAVKTVIDWEPDFEYEILGGTLRQHTTPSSNVRLWVVGVPDIPDQFGGHKCFVEGGLNLKFIRPSHCVHVDGRAPKKLKYTPDMHTNKIRIIITHDAGLQHDVQMVLEFFKE